MWTAENWPIAPSLQQFAATLPDGRSATHAGASHWSDVAFEIHSAGFQHFDAFDSWVRVGDQSSTERRDFGESIRSEGLNISAISTSRHSPIDPRPNRGMENLRYLHRVIEAAEELDVKTVTMGLHEPLLPDQESAMWFWHSATARNPDDRETKKLAVRRFRELGQHAAESGIQVSLEIYEGTYLETSTGAIDLVDEIGLENVGINPDLGNIIRLHEAVEDWKEAFTRLLPYSNYWHLKNYMRDFDPVTGAYFTAPSTLAVGYIDFRWAIETALDLGYDAPLCVEQYGGDTLSAAAQNEAYIRPIIDTWHKRQARKNRFAHNTNLTRQETSV